MRFEVTVLGSSSAQPVKGRHHSAHALNVHEQFYLIDCGEGTQQRLAQAGISPVKIQAIFLTHLHGDHLYGLFPLLSTVGLSGRKTPMTIFAPEPFSEILRFYREYLEPNLEYGIEWVPVNTRETSVIYANKVMEVVSVPLRHRIPASGYLFREKKPPLNVCKDAIQTYGLTLREILQAKNGQDIVRPHGTITGDAITYRPYKPRSYAYISDTMYSGKVVSIIKGVDLLYHEATFSQTDKALAKATGHSTTLDAAKAAAGSGASRLLIGHFSGRYKDPLLLQEEARTVFENTEAVIEGHTYGIPIEKYPDES